MTDITDAILRSAIELQRLSLTEEARAEQLLRQLEADLRALLNTRTLSASGKREIEALIKQAHDAITGKYINIAGILDVDGIVQHVAEQTVNALGGDMPGVETLRSLARDVLIEGSPASAWWARQADDTDFKFAGAVRRGVLNGRTNEAITREVVDVLDVSRRNARALVHSSIMTAANKARLEAYRKNMRFSSGVKWLATLDSHTCRTCAALDGSQWDFDGKPLKGTKFDFQAPPAHMLCRCVITPLPLSFDELGFEGMDAAIANIGARASSQGPLKSGTTFADFLKRQSPEWVDDFLGAKRADLYRAGKLTVTDLLTKGGREKTLAELTR